MTLVYKSATFWKEYIIYILNHEVSKLNTNSHSTTISYWLRYHRLKENISQATLAKRIGIKYANYITNSEIHNIYPNKEMSRKLSIYFNLPTKYFYDPYFEILESIGTILVNYRTDNNLNIQDAASLINVAPYTWSCWEKGKYELTRENYYKLKELKIL